MNNHANIIDFKPGFRTRTRCYTGLRACGFIHKLPASSSFDWEAVELVRLWPGWSACRRGCLKGKTAHANPPALSLGLTPELLCCAACCPCTDMLLVRVSSICALCNIFCLSSCRSATSLQSQKLVNTNHIYSHLLWRFYCGESDSLLN